MSTPLDVVAAISVLGVAPGFRTQFDGLNDEMSAKTATFNDGSFPARQEFKDEADINVLLRRYGVVPVSAADYGEFDDTLTLQDAYERVKLAEQAFSALDVKFRQRYKSWQELYSAIEEGRFVAQVDGLPAKPVEPVKES